MRNPTPPKGRVLALVNGKGGVGKTTLAVHVAEGLAETGLKTLLLDVDPQQSATWWGDPEQVSSFKSETSLLSDPRELEGLIPQLRKHYAAIVIDTVPNLYSEALQQVVAVSDLVLVPTAPDTLLELRRSIETARSIMRQGTPCMLILNRVDPRSQVEMLRVLNELRGMGLMVSRTPVKALKAYRVAANEQTTVWRCSHASSRAAGLNMRGLLQELAELLELQVQIPRLPER